MESNQSNRTKNIEKLVSAFSKIQKIPKALIRYGIYAFLGIYVIGIVLVILNSTLLQYDPYLDMVSKEMVKTSFIIAAEAVIGGLVLDYASRK